MTIRILQCPDDQMRLPISNRTLRCGAVAFPPGARTYPYEIQTLAAYKEETTWRQSSDSPHADTTYRALTPPHLRLKTRHSSLTSVEQRTPKSKKHRDSHSLASSEDPVIELPAPRNYISPVYELRAILVPITNGLIRLNYNECPAELHTALTPNEFIRNSLAMISVAATGIHHREPTAGKGPGVIAQGVGRPFGI